MRRGDGEVGRRGRLVSGGGEARRHVFVEDDEGAGRERGRQRSPTRVHQWRMPGVVVGIDVTDDEGVGVFNVVEERAKVRRVARWT